MKKKWIAAAAACTLFAVLFAPAAGSAEEEPIAVYVDTQQLVLDQSPIIENGATLVQLRPIFERLGLAVTWDGQSQTVSGTKDGVRIDLAIDNSIAVANGLPYRLEAAPRLINGSTFIPLKFVSEATGAKVVWYDNFRSVGIYASDSWKKIL